MLKTHELKPTIPISVLRQPPTYYPAENLTKKISRLPTEDELPCNDGVPMETARHKYQMDLLIYPLNPWLAKQGGGFVGGNMFVYFSPKQVLNEEFKGPDVFVVRGVSNRERKSWVVWQEGKGPDIVIELLSESTTTKDKVKNRRIYQDNLKVPEYYWFDPFNYQDRAGFRLEKGVYQPIPIDKQDRIISQQLGLALIPWHGIYEEIEATWLRWATLEGELLPTPQEIAEAEKQRADAGEQRAKSEKQRADSEKQRADSAIAEAKVAKQKAKAAEDEIARLKALLAESKG